MHTCIHTQRMCNSHTSPFLHPNCVNYNHIVLGEVSCLCQSLLNMLLANSSTFKLLPMAFRWLHHDLFCSEIDMNVSKEGSRDMKTYRERKCCWQGYKDCRWKKSVETSPTDNGDIFQLPGNCETTSKALVHTPSIQM